MTTPVLPAIEPFLSLVVAATPSGVIGDRGQMPWRLSSDLGRFKQITMGGTLVMGRKTFDSIGRPLPGRQTIVVTRQPRWRYSGAAAQSAGAAVQTAGELPELLRQIDALGRPAFVVGGAEIYRWLLPLVAEIWLTVVWSGVSGDTRVQIPTDSFGLVQSERFPQTLRDSAPTELQRWVRKKIRAKNAGPH